MEQWVLARAPATTANLGPGFDTLGMALGWDEELRAALAPSGVHLVVPAHVSSQVPAGAENLVARAAQAALRAAGAGGFGLRLRLGARLPVGRGLGSSAAAVAVGLVAANALLGNPLRAQELLDLGAQIEGHPDNVAPALAGGLCVSCLVQGEQAVRVVTVRLDPPRALEALVAVPDRPLATHEARRVLPALVPLGDAVANVQRASLLVAAVATGRLELLAEATRDRLHQRYRGRLLPGLEAALAGALEGGALGAFLSGAGPSVLALVPSGQDCPGVRAALEHYLVQEGGGRILRLALASDGASAAPCPPP